MNSYLFFGSIAVYLIGAISALIFKKKNRLFTYASFFGFYVDKLSAFFILIISITGFAVSIYSTGYVTEYFGKKNIGYLGFLYNIFILSMVLVVCANNAVMFLIVWELMSIISYLLVMYEHEKKDTRKAGFI